jgi:hypothetical protein
LPGGAAPGGSAPGTFVPGKGDPDSPCGGSPPAEP